MPTSTLLPTRAPWMPPPGMAPPGWYPDPHGVHQYRWWSGVEWTRGVANNGIAGTDPTYR